MHKLHVVRFQDEVELNVECARWNSAAGVTLGMIFTAARRTVPECVRANTNQGRMNEVVPSLLLDQD